MSALSRAQAQAARCVREVVFKRRSLTEAIALAGSSQARHLAYQTLRRYNRLDALARRMLAREQTAISANFPKEKSPRDGKLRALLAAAIGQIDESPPASYPAIVHSAVDAAAALCGETRRALANAVLRKFAREREELLAEVCKSAPLRYLHPKWWLDKLRAEYPRRWRDFAEHANAAPPLTLRINRRRIGKEDYLAQLARAGLGAHGLEDEKDAVVLTRPCAAADIPGFAEGQVSVQDAAMQRAADIAAVAKGASVLDCCAAPGGKAAHLLERADIALTAADISSARLQKAGDNFSRLGLSAELICADVRELRGKLGGRVFDFVLCDAPCSASGVVRRHPDIKWLRRKSDIAAFASAQRELLCAAAAMVAPGGRLLYATCSLFAEENEEVARAFAAEMGDRFALQSLNAVLPAAFHDGAFYALFARSAGRARAFVRAGKR
jgi:16S rRNA (cytosine967-C5)-methyltransferase